MARTTDLYVGSVPVEDQSPAARDGAFPLALMQVLGKLSGLRDLDQNEEVVEAVGFARSLVISFYYEQIEAEPLTAGQVAAEPQDQTLLAVRFAREGTDELLQALQLPRWRSERPPLEVWLLIDDGFSRQVLPLEYEYLRTPLDDVAWARGLPLQWPRPDAEGNYGVDVQLLWGGYTDELEIDGETGNVLIFAARREGPEWSSRQILNYGGEYWSWRNRDINLEAALSDAMNVVVDEIAAVQAISASEQGSWIHRISVGGLSSGDDYIRCIEYLESLSVVEEVSVATADPLAVTMVLVLNAAPDYLQQVLEGDQVLESEDGSSHYVLQQ
jgi:hypothetical protein